MVKPVVLATLATAAAAADVTLATFGTSDATYRTWRQQNDPVMGGASSGKFTVSDGVGTMEGTCALIPRLQAPGFIKTTASGKYDDVSSCTGIELEVRSDSDYKGYRFDFGNDASACGKFFARGYKAPFSAPVGSFGKVQIPFNEFSRCWDDGSGEILKSCAEDPSLCPTKARLQDLQALSVWAEGVEGDVKIDIKSVGAYGCGAVLAASASAVDLATFDDAKNWKTEIDPVMGGVSVGTATVESGHGILDGEVKLIPSLKAPGFIQAQSEVKVDASSAAGGDLVMMVRSSTPDYAGFKMSFAASSFLGFGCKGPSSNGCYKAPFTVPAGNDFTEVRIPLTDFSDKWDSATGELTTLCKDDPSVCPSASKLTKVQRLAVWAEGTAGKVHIEFDKVSLEPPKAAATLV